MNYKKIVSIMLMACCFVLGVQSSAMAEEPGNRVFFRGGYADLTEDRVGGGFTDLYALGGANDSDSGWYAGAGFDFLLSKDTLGLLPGTWTLAELSVEFRHLGSEEVLLMGPTATCALGAGLSGLPAIIAGGCAVTGEQDLTMLSVSASPKLKFNEGGKLRPWIIPVGMEFNVISPPTDSTNYLDFGAVFAGGIDYMIMPGITLGIDARYHLSADLNDPEISAATKAAFAALGATIDTDQDSDTWTIGASLGISF